MRCPLCTSLDDKVVDSRLAEEGAAIRRRRECLACGKRYTTFERIEEVPLLVVKRSGHRSPFERTKIVAGLQAATKNRPVSVDQLEALAAEVEEVLRLDGPEVTSQQIGVAVLERLRFLDQVAYLRFASVYKGFEDAGDFEREVGLLTKSTEPKQPGVDPDPQRAPAGRSDASPNERRAAGPGARPEPDAGLDAGPGADGGSA